MDGVLCSTNFQKFFSRIINEAETISDLVTIMRESVHLIAGEICLGRLDFEVDSRDALDELGIGTRNYTVFTEDYYNSAYKLEKPFKTHDNGMIKITLFPTSGHVWNEAEEETVNFLIQTLFVICAKTRVFNEVHNLATMDQLTGVLNRQGFARFCESNLLNGKIGGHTAVFMNIRNFKFINQNVGTRSGDKILKAYAKKLVELSKGGTVARIGGDNFLVLVENDYCEEFIEATANIPISLGDFVRFDLTAKSGRRR